MARMIYTQQPSVRSESMVFDALKNSEHTTDWIVFYSLYVPKLGGDPFEIDFLVIIPEYFSVICLEVKGGSYDMEDGIWYPLDFSGHRRARLRKPPQNKVTDTMWTLKNGCERKGLKGFGDIEYLSLGCAVAFTDLSKPPSDLSGHLAPSIWSNDVQDRNKLREKLNEIAKKMCNRRGPRNKEEKRKAQIYLADLRNDLEPNSMSITKNRIFSSDLATLREELLVLTNDQLHGLDLVNDNDCCVIDGAAGTGKTVLAMELTRQRWEDKGEKVALLCSNPYLSSRFERWMRKLSKDHSNPHLNNPFARLAKTLSKGRSSTVVAGTLEDFLTVTSQKKKFNYLIIDEAQNLCDEASLDLMNELLEGGLTNGCWTMFGDFAHQKIISPDLTESGEEVLKRLKHDYPRLTHGRLKINCRNTYEIAAAVSMFVQIESPPRSGAHGPLIKTEYFDSPEGLDNLLDHLVYDLKRRKFSSRQIILLSSGSDDFNTLSSREYGGWKLLNVREAKGEKDLDREEVPDISGDSSSKTLRYSNVHDFQGLESEVVILVLPLTEKQAEVGGTATLHNYKHRRRVLYTGMSRAKVILIIVAHKSYSKHLELKPRSGITYEEHRKSIDRLVSRS